MRWFGPEVVGDPPDPERVVLPLAAVKSFLGMTREQTEDDGTLNAIRRAVVADVEHLLMRAVYPVTRRYTASYAASDAPVCEYHLEPWRVAPAPIVLRNGTPLPHTLIGGRLIRLNELYQPADNDLVTIEIAAGWTTPPANLLQWMLAEVNGRLERKRQAGAKNTERLAVPRGMGLEEHVAWNEPLDESDVEVRGGGYWL